MASAERRKSRDGLGRVVRAISIHENVWEWLKTQPGGASGWIDYTAGRAMVDDENAKLKKENVRARGEIQRLTDQLNALQS